MESKNVEYVLPVVKDDKKSRLSKKKKVILTIVAVILALAIVFVCILVFADKTVKGSWLLVVNPEKPSATIDQIDENEKACYVFTEPGEYGDGTYTVYYNSSVEHGEYKLSNKKGVDYINMGTGDIRFEISGNKILGTAKMTLTLGTDKDNDKKTKESVYVFEQTEAPKYTSMSYDNYNVDSKLLKKWITNERYLSYMQYKLPYTQTVEFLDNGIMTINYVCEDMLTDVTLYYAYTIDGDKLYFSPVTNKEAKHMFDYKIDSNGNLKFINDTTTQSFNSDAFFSDVTYYTQDNLPQTTEAVTE